MTLTGMEAALIGGFFITAGAIIGGIVIYYLNSSQCTKCGITELKKEIEIHLRGDIKVQFFLIRHLAEKSGLTESDLLRIETMARQNASGSSIIGTSF